MLYIEFIVQDLQTSLPDGSLRFIEQCGIALSERVVAPVRARERGDAALQRLDARPVLLQPQQ